MLCWKWGCEVVMVVEVGTTNEKMVENNRFDGLWDLKAASVGRNWFYIPYFDAGDNHDGPWNVSVEAQSPAS